MRKNPPIPLVIIFLAFVVIPVAFWWFTFKKPSNDVRGVATGSSGVLVKIVSKNGAWDMSKYLCEDISICMESLTSGKSLEKTSGGGGSDQSLVIRPTSDWSPYEYVKIFAKSGWGSRERFFTASFTENIKEGLVKKFNFGGNTYEAVILPIDLLTAQLLESVIFSD
jgi:hypothetical protein